MAQITMSEMLKAGLQFGHQTRRWNPKMKQYILTERNGIYIINLFKTLDLIDVAYDFIKTTVAHNGTVLFVGTKKQAQEAIKNAATRVNMPYVSERWLGGMLTNFQTVSKRVNRLKELETMDFDDVHGSGLTKKELLLLKREKDKLERQLGGIRNMTRTPSAMFVVDINKEAWPLRKPTSWVSRWSPLLTPTPIRKPSSIRFRPTMTPSAASNCSRTCSRMQSPRACWSAPATPPRARAT